MLSEVETGERAMVSDALFFFTICAHLRNLRMSQNYLQQPNFYVQAIGGCDKLYSNILID